MIHPNQKSIYHPGLIALFLLSILTNVAVAQEGWSIVNGQVIDSLTNQPITGANIHTEDGSAKVLADRSGMFSIAVPTGTTSLEIETRGYKKQVIPIDGRNNITIALKEEVNTPINLPEQGYGTIRKDQITSATASLSHEDFNRGNINDPNMLWQGKVAGFGIYNKGDDPNSSAVLRIRGLTTLGKGVNPLIVIDGVINASLENVDPNDIASIQVLKDGSAAAIYGIRASHGVVLITTKQGERNSGVHVDYKGYAATAEVARYMPGMDRVEYLAAGGNDLGTETDWQKEVTRTAISNVHHLSISGGSENTLYRASVNFRDINGVLSNSDLERVNVRAGLQQYAFNDRLKVSFNLSLTENKSNFSFYEGLRYAIVSNPTAPIRFENGDYYQAIVFDNFNPVALTELNTNTGKRKLLNFNTQITYKITDKLAITANYGQQNRNELNAEYYSRQSFFRGFNRGGLARRYVADSQFRLLETYAYYSHSTGSLAMDFTGGYSFQQDEFEDISIEIGDFPNDELGYRDLGNAADRISGIANNVGLNSSTSPKNQVIGFFGRVNLMINESIFLNASLRSEGSSKLGRENQWGLFPAIGAGVSLDRFLNTGNLDLLKFRVGYGLTGGLPISSGLSQPRYAYIFDNGGTITLDHQGNPDLGHEVKKEFNMGVDFSIRKKFNGSLDVYQRRIEDIILFLSGPDYPESFYDNSGALQTRGMELTLHYDNLQFGAFNWSSSLILSSYKTTLERFTVDEDLRANLGAPGQGSGRMIRIAEGEEIGQFWGPVFTGEVDQDGYPVFEDVNGDGELNPYYGSSLASNSDTKELGNASPDLEAGWHNVISYKRWDLNLFFRGAFGHSLVNMFRVFYEPVDPGAINSYNRVITDKAVEGLAVSYFSSLYVENASFLSLDNATIGYSFNVDEGRAFQKIRLNFTVQNAFTLTNYTGLDPDPVVQDLGPIDNGAFRYPAPPDVLSPGIDRRNNYFSARTFLVGLTMSF